MFLRFLLTPIAWLALSAETQAVTPAPDGGYPGNNTAEGTSALFSLTSGSNNTAFGFQALYHDTSGSNNTASGVNALYSNTTGDDNTANGFQALHLNTTGDLNTANGFAALENSTTGSDNSGKGFQALLNHTGSNNIGVGSNAGSNLTTGDNNIDIGVADEANTIRIGNKGTHNGAFVAGISGAAVTGNQVIVNSNGKLGITVSSARYKDAIKPMDKASEAILALKPVTAITRSLIQTVFRSSA